MMDGRYYKAKPLLPLSTGREAGINLAHYFGGWGGGHIDSD